MAETYITRCRPRKHQSGLRSQRVKMLIVFIFSTCVSLSLKVNAGSVDSTTKSYDLQLPGSTPIRIIESEPLWGTTESSLYQQRAYSPEKSGFEKDNFSPLDDETNQQALQQFLTEYADNIRRNKNKKTQFENVELITKPTIRDEEKSEKSKSWDLLNYQKHNHPYQDPKGWVSMDPVPWSVAKISRWQSSHKATQRPFYGDYEDEPYSEALSTKPWFNRPQRPNFETNNNHDRYDNIRPSASIYPRPSATYGHKVQVEYDSIKNKYHNKYPNYNNHQHDENCNQDHRGEIITDGLPANFPHAYESNRRRGTDMDRSDNHPFTGEGEWVLLSTTRGYKYPPGRQRSLQINPDAIGAHRTVRLTVLPPLKNSKINMTTSHGGLLQVESTFKTVEQSQKEFAKRQKKINKRKKIKNSNKNNHNSEPVDQIIQQEIVRPTAVVSQRNTGQLDSSAVLAAVGAGMIPATMAMLVPMAMGGRKKRGANTIRKL